MPEFRKDFISGEWVIIAEERLNRPDNYFPQKNTGQNIQCPFCEGNESLTPEELYAIRPDQISQNGPGWTIRVVPNKYPALIEINDEKSIIDNVFYKQAGTGYHEVIIESAKHGETFFTFDIDKILEIIKTYIQRINTLKRKRNIKYITVFKNFGFEAGASIEHSHSQILAIPMIPKLPEELLKKYAKYHNNSGNCFQCEILKKEIGFNQRIVLLNEDFAVVEPYFSKFPFETRLIPLKHQSRFECMNERQKSSLAEVLHKIMALLHKKQKNLSYNLILFNQPTIYKKDLIYFHWHIEILPRITQIAGFEWGTGMFINPMPPEKAAESLRKLLSKI